MNERTHFFIKNIPLALYSRKGWCFCGVWEMCGETYTQRVDFFFPYLLPGASGVHSLVILCILSKSDSVVLVTWSPSGYILFVPACSVYKPQCDSLSKHAGSLGTNRKSILYTIWPIDLILTGIATPDQSDPRKNGVLNHSFCVLLCL